MSDFKSKLPDLKEVTSMAGKLFGDIKHSVCEIIDSYKAKREEPSSHKKTQEAGEVVSSTHKEPKKAESVKKSTAAKKPAKPRVKKTEK